MRYKQGLCLFNPNYTFPSNWALDFSMYAVSGAGKEPDVESVMEKVQLNVSVCINIKFYGVTSTST